MGFLARSCLHLSMSGCQSLLILLKVPASQLVPLVAVMPSDLQACGLCDLLTLLPTPAAACWSRGKEASSEGQEFSGSLPKCAIFHFCSESKL